MRRNIIDTQCLSTMTIRSSYWAKVLSLLPLYKSRPTTKGGHAGDFSFAQSLIDVHQLPPSNITATAFDSEPECYAKYEWSKATIHQLRQKGATILFRVDATKLDAIKKLRGKTWTKIVWNFPHAGATWVGLAWTSLILTHCRKGNYRSGPEHP